VISEKLLTIEEKMCPRNFHGGEPWEEVVIHSGRDSGEGVQLLLSEEKGFK
jgi:hypothetical protein